MNKNFWTGKRVFVTGHTGFKGSWLCILLKSLGAELYGYSLAPPTSPNLFTVANVSELLVQNLLADIRDAATLKQAVADAAPNVIFHLAAQSLVGPSYVAPLETYEVNVMGTLNILEAARTVGSVGAFVNVTTDKCYENKEWNWAYRENEPLGGLDPYSNSKACSELVTMAYRSSFHQNGEPWIASARAGNVIGGGDWATDRLLPDIFRAMDKGETVKIRRPGSSRPWQHVLEPLSGYVALAERLLSDGRPFAKPFNFGPPNGDARSVAWILEQTKEICSDLKWEIEDEHSFHEAGLLKLDSSEAEAKLGWQPRWSFSTAIGKTVDWHLAWRENSDMRAFCLQQIDQYLVGAA